MTSEQGFAGLPLRDVSPLLCRLINVLPERMRSVLGGLVFDQLSGPSTPCHQKDLLPLPAWQPTVSDIVDRYATGISEAEARSRNA